MKCYEILAFNAEPDFAGLQLAERETPTPGPGELRVRIKACSLNYRDLMMVRGHYNPKLPFPRVPLSDGVGVVEALGPGVEGVEVGQRVLGCFFQRYPGGQVTVAGARSALGGELDGVLAEQVLLRAEGVVPVPEYLSDVQAATLPCAALTAWTALIPHLKPGERVLTLGSGGVSVFALQIAARAGAEVIVTSSSDAKLERLRTMGAAHGVNYRAVPDWEQAVLDFTGGQGVDHVIEVGGQGTLPRSLKAVRLGGHVALIGVLAGAGEAPFLPVVMKRIRLQGVFVGSRDDFLAMNRFLELHRIEPVVDRVFPFAAARDAYAHLASGGHLGKVVIAFEA